MKKFVVDLRNELTIKRWRVMLKTREYYHKKFDTLTECFKNIREKTWLKR